MGKGRLTWRGSWLDKSKLEREAEIRGYEKQQVYPQEKKMLLVFTHRSKVILLEYSFTFSENKNTFCSLGSSEGVGDGDRGDDEGRKTCLEEKLLYEGFYRRIGKQ